MLRRFVLTAALVGCAVAPAFAQTRATYVLTNGERHNGYIVYGRGDNNIVDDRFQVNSSGAELVFPIDEVAVIDFAGGTPATAELQALPNDTQLMVMRNGSTQRGHLHNIIKGDYVQWVNEAGQRNNVPIGEVRRLYLNPDNARTSFFRNSTAGVGTAGVLSAGVLRIDGNQQWVDTGIDVRRGDRIAINATGQIRYAPNVAVTAAGTRAGSSPASYPVPSMGAGGLIARVGDSAPFAVGAGTREMTMPADGRLYLGINDDDVSDNSGSFTVTVRKR